MSHGELDGLRAEASALESMLADTPPDELIVRMGFEARLAECKDRIRVLQESPQPKRLPVVFGGQPVEGMRTIDASFATSALKAFVEATEVLRADRSSEELKGTGRLPGAGERALRIAHTTPGSFGFELELPPASRAALEGAGLELAADDTHERGIATTLDLLQYAASGDDNTLSELIAEVHPRAAAKVCAFVKILDKAEAWFGAEFEGKRVRLDTREQVRRSVEALEAGAEELEEDCIGEVVGILPVSKRFECKLPDGAILSGKLGPKIENVAAFKSQWEGRPARLRFRIVRVRQSRKHVLEGATPPDEPVVESEDGRSPEPETPPT